MSRFSLKDLLVSTTLVAIGLGAIVVVIEQWPHDVDWPDGVLFIIGTASIGAGILGLAKRPWIGAIIGASIGLTGVAAVIIHAMNVFMRM